MGITSTGKTDYSVSSSGAIAAGARLTIDTVYVKKSRTLSLNSVGSCVATSTTENPFIFTIRRDTSAGDILYQFVIGTGLTHLPEDVKLEEGKYALCLQHTLGSSVTVVGSVSGCWEV